MKPLYLYIENFTCYKKSELDLSNITSALIVGRQDNNELESNGIGKTSIFRAIEYALFAQTRHPVLGKDIMLERLIQDEAAKLLVIFDFEMEGEIYRISRARTRKGATDLYFYRRNAVDGSAHTSNTDKALWTDLTCRRTADTDAGIAKVVRIGYKSFINTSHSMQLDVGGIATATPEKRRAILKDVLDLLPYGALEKIGKKHSDELSEAIRRDKAILASIGNPEQDVIALQSKITAVSANIEQQSLILTSQKEQHVSLNNDHIALTTKLNTLESNVASIIQRHTSLSNEVSKLQVSKDDYTKKCKLLITEAKNINTDIAALKTAKDVLIGIDFSYLSKLQQALDASKKESEAKSITLGIAKAELLDLNIPMPEDGTCKHCRTVLTPEHRRACMADIEKQKGEKSNTIKALSSYLKTLQTEQSKLTTSISQLETQQKQLIDLIAKLTNKDKERQDKKALYDEYNVILKGFETDLVSKQTELEQAKLDVDRSSVSEIASLKQEVMSSKKSIEAVLLNIELSNKQVNELQSNKAVLLHSIEEKTKDIKRQDELKQTIASFEEQLAIHPYVIQAFASIPDIIIENVLEGLQEETNKLLAQIRPELQLSFSTEKTRSDGEQEDTLEINYLLNNKPKDYSQLSGAQQLCVMFAFKLGLSFLLKSMNGSQIKFLMLDEVDMPFSHAAIDAYAEIIRFFQKDFTVFVITHNDRLKSKFSNAILVEQDRNGVSRAKIVNSW